MDPIQLIGDADTVLAFRLGGISGQAVSTAAAARDAIDRIVEAVHQEGGPLAAPVLLLVTHGTAERIRPYLEAVTLDPTAPLVLEIPGVGEEIGYNPVGTIVRRLLGGAA